MIISISAKSWVAHGGLEKYIHMEKLGNARILKCCFSFGIKKLKTVLTTPEILFIPREISTNIKLVCIAGIADYRI